MEGKKYFAKFFEDGEYIGVEFPDLPGCYSQGRNFEEAKLNASKALGRFLGEINFYPSSESPQVEQMIEPVEDLAETHALFINPPSRRRIVFPKNQECLGEKLTAKIKEAAGLQ